MNQAVIIIDMQRDYFPDGAMALNNPEKASQNAKRVLDYFRENSLPVIHIQHFSAQPDASFFIPNTIGVEIYDLVKPLENEKVIVKHFPNSFRETELLDYLKENNIQTLVICGMMTHMCVDATTRASKDLGFDNIVIGDACATKDLELNGSKVKAEDVQTSFLAALNYFYSEVMLTEEFLKGN